MNALIHSSQHPTTDATLPTIESASSALLVVELAVGLRPAELDRRLLTADRQTDVGHREIAFYLADMDARGVHQLLGFASTRSTRCRRA